MAKKLITKSLFVAVYNCDISKDRDMLLYYHRVNIYEFAFKCKEWALEKGFNIFSSCKSFSIFENGNWIISSSGEDNEIEAIINACNWILESKNENL